MNDAKQAAREVPSWLPLDVQNYVFHTEMGHPIRALARSQACHASTILRQIRKVETRRDDPLVDQAIKALSDDDAAAKFPNSVELMQALRRLAAPASMLAIAVGMAQGVIVQDTASAEPDHASTLAPSVAMILALRGWIRCTTTTGRVLRYRITSSGRVALRELTAQTENHARTMAESPGTFAPAPKGVGCWDAGQMVRVPLQESPVVSLSRRRDRDGQAFLNRAMVRASERLREDYELAQVDAQRHGRPSPNWVQILHAIEMDAPVTLKGTSAEAQVRSALGFLGPGLSEVALRCCCLLEGLEATEKQMGWAARSGKVVLRIALQRLVLHYESAGKLGPLIG